MRTQQTLAVTIVPLTDVFFHAHVVWDTDKRLNSKRVTRESCHYLAWIKQHPSPQHLALLCLKFKGKQKEQRMMGAEDSQEDSAPFILDLGL